MVRRRWWGRAGSRYAAKPRSQGLWYRQPPARKAIRLAGKEPGDGDYAACSKNAADRQAQAEVCEGRIVALAGVQSQVALLGWRRQSRTGGFFGLGAAAGCDGGYSGESL